MANERKQSDKTDALEEKRKQQEKSRKNMLHSIQLTFFSDADTKKGEQKAKKDDNEEQGTALLYQKRLAQSKKKS